MLQVHFLIHNGRTILTQQAIRRAIMYINACALMHHHKQLECERALKRKYTVAHWPSVCCHCGHQLFSKVVNFHCH